LSKNQADEPLEISYEDIPAGTLVEVVRGKLAGFQGEMVQIRDKYRIVLRLEPFEKRSSLSSSRFKESNILTAGGFSCLNRLIPFPVCSPVPGICFIK